MSLNVLEIRNYLLKPGLREHFIDYFEANFITTQADVNMFILGQFRLIGEPDHFVWMRAYENMDTRLNGLLGFYDGPIWKQHRTLCNSMLVDSDNVHLLRPLDGNPDLTAGQTPQAISAALIDASISPNTGLIAVDFYDAQPGQREALIDSFCEKIQPLYHKHEVQFRGAFVGEMGHNKFPRHPAIQNEHELVVITAHKSEAACQKARSKLAPSVNQALGPLLSLPPTVLLLSPTLRSPVRYVKG